MTFDHIKNILIIANALLSILMVFISVKNSKIQKSSHLLNVQTARINATNLDLVETKEFDGNIVVKLAFFNPGSNAAIIKSLSVSKIIDHPNIFLKALGLTKDINIQYSWSPAIDESKFKISLYKDAFKLLHVKTTAVLFVSIPGDLDRDTYCFEIRTNQGSHKLYTTIDGHNAQFPTDYRIWYKD